MEHMTKAALAAFVFFIYSLSILQYGAPDISKQNHFVNFFD